MDIDPGPGRVGRGDTSKTQKRSNFKGLPFLGALRGFSQEKVAADINGDAASERGPSRDEQKEGERGWLKAEGLSSPGKGGGFKS